LRILGLLSCFIDLIVLAELLAAATTAASTLVQDEKSENKNYYFALLLFLSCISLILGTSTFPLFDTSRK
jgi:hypothetical protein